MMNNNVAAWIIVVAGLCVVTAALIGALSWLTPRVEQYVTERKQAAEQVEAVRKIVFTPEPTPGPVIQVDSAGTVRFGGSLVIASQGQVGIGTAEPRPSWTVGNVNGDHLVIDAHGIALREAHGKKHTWIYRTPEEKKR